MMGTGAGSSGDGGQQVSLPALPAAGSSTVGPAFPPMVFDDPVGARTPAQLTAFAETTRVYVDTIAAAVDRLSTELGGLEAAFRGETEGIRQQAGAIISGMQQRAEEVIGRMHQDQADARGRMEMVVTSANTKFQEIDGLITATHQGLRVNLHQLGDRHFGTAQSTGTVGTIKQLP